ncbi:hypothetical protein [Halotia branconii]|uniref:Uncharacterized protein n=1 Tax=Halotia branconii CENA392 TaxID=1539056 RepID=A0AAJ6NYD0_9CYAN|nr:hypothetical protein [Halotia branconii]WGV29014.1 hypothetical protein QI031_31125 [Halotia branconii CENA392]
MAYPKYTQQASSRYSLKTITVAPNDEQVTAQAGLDQFITLTGDNVVKELVESRIEPESPAENRGVCEV